MKFLTARLSIENLTVILSNPSAKQIFERELENILIAQITRYLPPSMQFSAGHGSISNWIEERINEAQILCVHSRDTRMLVGLIILAEDPEVAAHRTVHVGYFIGEKDWGNGYATEIVTGLVANFQAETGTILRAGVDSENIASARVLEKSGFKKPNAQSTGDQAFYELKVV